MSDTQYLRAKHFRNFSEFTIERVYPFYRNGGIEVDGKFQGKTFRYVDNKLQEETWDKVNGKNVKTLVPVTEKIGGDFFKIYKKVFDIRITTPTEITVDGKKGNCFTIESLGSFKIKEMLREDFSIVIPMNGDKEAFDWEDDVYKSLEGKTFQMKVTGAGLETKYKFKLVGDKNVVKNDGEDELGF